MDWQEVERFDNPQMFNRSEIKAMLGKQMRKHKVWRSMGEYVGTICLQSFQETSLEVLSSKVQGAAPFSMFL